MSNFHSADLSNAGVIWRPQLLSSLLLSEFGRFLSLSRGHEAPSLSGGGVAMHSGPHEPLQ
jgi:hypothetical protein